MNMISLLLFFSFQPASGANLATAVTDALRRSPAVAQSQARINQAEAAKREAFWSRWPRLSAQGALLRSDDPLFSFGQLLQERKVTPSDFNPATLNHPGYRTAVRGSLELGMPLFTGFTLTRAATLADLSILEAGTFSRLAMQAVSLRVTHIYLRMLKTRLFLHELDERIASSENEIANAERLKKQGLILGSDHMAALAVLSSLKAWRARTTAEMAAYQAELSILIGANAPERLDGKLLPWDPIIDDDETLIANALTTRQDLSIAEVKIKTAHIQGQGVRHSVSASVDAFAALNTAADGLNNGAGSRIFGVRAKLPFGDPSYLSRIAKADAEMSSAKAARANLEDSARSEIFTHAAALRGLHETLPFTDQSVTQARESLKLVRPLYREGRQSVLDVLRAEEAVARLEEIRLESSAQVRLEWAALKAAQGRFDESAISTLSQSLEKSHE
jgi:outer membrane protein TolC